MAIKREYKTKEECVGLYIEEGFDAFPSWALTKQPNFYENWSFMAALDEEEAEEEGEEYGYTFVYIYNHDCKELFETS